MNFSLKGYFSTFEKLLWASSVLLIIFSYVVFGRSNPLTLTASLIGVTALIFCAKGNPVGQMMMIVFASIYGYISYHFHYYGELITYMGMSLPMAVFSLVSWLRNPYDGNRAEVKVNHISRAEAVRLVFIASAVTVIFYFLLKFLGTANLPISTLSVATSFSAAYLVFRRNEFFALMYAINDVVLIGMWTLASFTDISYLGVVICFAVFLFNDLYSFYNWQRMKKRQSQN